MKNHEEEYDYIVEMENLITAYEELCWLMSEHQNNESEKGFLPVKLMEKMNDQLRDHFSHVSSELRITKDCMNQLLEQKREKTHAMEALN